MIYLRTNQPNQSVYLTLLEERRNLPAFTNYLIRLTIEDHGAPGDPANGTALNQVATVVIENDRFTLLQITTVGLTISGRYRYLVYGQNSPTNTDPSDASVVGLVETGLAVVDASIQYFSEPSVTIPANEFLQS